MIDLVVLLLSIFVFFFSWRASSRQRWQEAVWLLMVAGLILRCYTASDLFLHSWDERYHALVAKHLMTDPLRPVLYDRQVIPADDTNWTLSHIWLHKQPLPLWGMALSMKLLGVSEWALRVPSVLLTTMGIWLTFYIGRFYAGARAGYIAALLYAVNGLIIELAAGRVATDHVDIFFLFFIEAAIYCSIRFVEQKRSVYNVLAGLCIGAAILSKWLPALIVLPIWLLIVVDVKQFSRKQILGQCLLLVGVLVAVSLPWQLYIQHAFPLEAQWEAAHRSRHITEVLDGQGGPWYYYLEKIRINYGELIYLPLVWVFWYCARQQPGKKWWALLFWICIPVLFFSFVQTKMQAYILFTCPALFILTGAFYDWLLHRKNNLRLKWLYTLVLVLMIGLPARYCIERMKLFSGEDRNPAWVQALKNWKPAVTPRSVLFNYNAPVEAMFYTNLTVYETLPEEAVLQGLSDKHYDIYINDNGQLPEYVRKIAGLQVVRLPAKPN